MARVVDLTVERVGNITVGYADLYDVYLSDKDGDRAELLVSHKGASKCMDEDEYDEDIGDALAVSRALASLAKQIEQVAFKKVYKKDRARRKSEQARELAKERQREAIYKWKCEFAELINLKLELEANDIVPEPVKTGKRKLVDGRKKQKGRNKAHQIRQDLPA